MLIFTGKVAGLCLLLALAWGVLEAKPYRAVEELPPDITDMHVHAAGLGAGGSGCIVAKKLKESWKFGFYLKSFGVTKEELEEKGDDLLADRVAELAGKSRYVRKLVFLALDGPVGADGALDEKNTELHVPNEFVLRAVKRHKNLLYGASVNPYRKDALERLEQAKKDGAVLIKWIPSIMWVDPADPKLEPFYRKLVKLKLPLLTHAGHERSFSSSKDEHCDPEKLRLPLGLGVTVIAAHIASTGKYGGEKSHERLIKLMKEYPNLYSEISSLTQLNKLKYLKIALRSSEFEGRLMYGSDFPLINMVLVSPWYYFNRLSPLKIRAINKNENPWDRDVLLKQALGAPADIFTRSRQVIGH